ncbi:MAG TPA: 2-oxoglutarate dehydrogenase complex dihydrolipoyllysine-residue succinyltransferase, partial [Verrucomicrobiae bacterium]|nr:2-oxoglutarate dehydrogenase complex dihydrolipoyllysine-residue succinyltransferase [Verrucomicrobiae bacterium]
TVKQDEPLAIIDSEKASLDLCAPQAGTLTKILHQAGEKVSVGEVVAQIESGGEATKPETTGKEKPTTPDPKNTDQEEKTEKSESAVSTEGDTSPVPAEEKKTEEDKKTAVKPANEETKPTVNGKTKTQEPKSSPTPARSKSSPGREEEVVPMTMLRRTVAKHLIEAQQTMAMLTTFNEIDMSAVQALRKEHQETFEKRYQVKLGFMSFFVKAAIDALKQFPQLNAEVRGDDVVYHNYFDISVAIATERGLVVPVLRNAERSSFAELEKAIGDFGRRAKDGKLKLDELTGGTFTITNGGVFGSLLSTPIINPPQTGILGMHTIQDRPVVVGGQIIIRPMMYAALTYDHRIVDGREAVLFLRRIKDAIETPARMLIEI